MSFPICRLCDTPDPTPVIDLGYHPLADTFLKKSQLSEPEIRYPLRLLLCQQCGYLMSEYVVPAYERYQKNEYSYDSANSPVAKRHFEELAQDIAVRTKLAEEQLVVDIGSNVGTLLTSIRNIRKVLICGVEPSVNIAQLAVQNGTPTLETLFTQEAVSRIQKEYGDAHVIIATNVFNHIEDVQDLLTNITALLTNDGYFVFEVPYVPELLHQGAFDTIYLEHVSYFSLTAHIPFFERYGLYFIHAEITSYMGGSIRCYFSKQKGRHDAPLLTQFLNAEKKAGVTQEQTYRDFMQKVRNFKANLVSRLYELKKGGAYIAGIGAATKGNTLLNYCGIDQELVTFIADTSPLKINKWTPGSHIPIKDEGALRSEGVTHGLILPWNIGPYLKEKLAYLPISFIIPHMDEVK